MRRHQPVVRIDIGEDDLAALIARAVGGGGEGDGRDDDRVAGLKIQGEHAEVQGRRPIGTGHGVARTDRLGEGLLERLDAWPGGQQVGAQGLGHRGDVVILDDLPAIGQKRLVLSHGRRAGS